MRRLLAIIGFAFFATACLALADNADDGILPPFSHYAVILERKPFGDLSKPAAQEPVPQPDQAAIEQAKEEQALARQVDMVAVNRTPRGKIAGTLRPTVVPSCRRTTRSTSTTSSC